MDFFIAQYFVYLLAVNRIFLNLQNQWISSDVSLVSSNLGLHHSLNMILILLKIKYPKVVKQNSDTYIFIK